jgi:hypothetical protein
MSEVIKESPALQDCLAGAESFRGRYIYHSKEWCDRKLHPVFDSLITVDYDSVVVDGATILYEKKVK